MWGTPKLTDPLDSSVTIALPAMQVQLAAHAPQRGDRHTALEEAVATIHGYQERFGDMLQVSIAGEQLSAPCCHVYTPAFAAHLNEMFLATGQRNQNHFLLIQKEKHFGFLTHK